MAVMRTTDRFIWLQEQAKSDPKLQQLYTELQDTWAAYKTKSHELDVAYLDEARKLGNGNAIASFINMLASRKTKPVPKPKPIKPGIPWEK